MPVLYIRCSEELHAALTRIAKARPPLTVAELARGILATAVQPTIVRDARSTPAATQSDVLEPPSLEERAAPYSRVSSVALSLDGELHVWTDDGDESYDDFVTRAVDGGRRPSSIHRSDCMDDSCTGCHPLNDLGFSR